MVERLGIVLDPELGLVAGAGPHDQAAGQPGRAADDAFGLGDEHALGPRLLGGQGGAEAGRPRADDHDIDIEALVHGTPRLLLAMARTLGDGALAVARRTR